MEFARYLPARRRELTEGADREVQGAQLQGRRRAHEGSESHVPEVPERPQPAAAAREGAPRRPRQGQPRAGARGPRRRQDGRSWSASRSTTCCAAAACCTSRSTRPSPTCAPTTTRCSRSSRPRRTSRTPRACAPRSTAARSIRAYPPAGFSAAKLREAVKLEREARRAPGARDRRGPRPRRALPRDELTELRALARELRRRDLALGVGCRASASRRCPAQLRSASSDLLSVILALEPGDGASRCAR